MSRRLKDVARELVARHPERVRSAEVSKPKRQGKRVGVMNASEEIYARERLEPFRRVGELRWRYEAIRLRLGVGVWYKPDFYLVWADGTRELREFKGSWKAKNARDSRVRLKIAASLYPEYRFTAVTRESGGYRHEKIRGETEEWAVAQLRALEAA